MHWQKGNESMKEDCFFISEEETGERLDKALASHFENMSRSYLQKLVKDGAVFVNGKPAKGSYKTTCGDEIKLQLPELKPISAEPEPIPLDILYEDEDVILINKPKGMVVHPAAGHLNGTLVNALLYHCENSLSGINGVLRPGIVHRIDMDTTGVIIACKNDEAHNCLAAQLKEHSITRKYRAILWHDMKEEEGTVDAPIGRHPKDRLKMAVNYQNGKRAVTHYRVLEHLSSPRISGSFSYVECRLETGRTHQIRVHMASIGHPLLGDTVYGPARQPFKTDGQVLHAQVFGFLHPRTGEYMEFSAPLPDYFEEILNKFRL